MIASGQTYTGNEFKRADLTHQTIDSAQFNECTFIHCDFSDAVLQSCRFIDCVFRACTMKMTQVENTTFARVHFDQCNLLGVNWTEANWSDWATKLSAVAFERCNLTYGVFLGLDLKKMVVKNCTAREVNFAEADLTEVDFSGTDLTGAIFLRTTLTSANFVSATHYTFNIADNTTTGAKFSLPEAIRLLHGMDIVLIDPDTNDALDADTLNDVIG